MIRRGLRDELETVVWIEPRVRGLPVFNRELGYAFEADGSRQLDPFTGRPLMLGDTLPADSGAASVEPSVTADRAKAIYLEHAVRDRPGSVNEAALEAVLGLAEGLEGRPHVLAWRVRPKGAGVPEGSSMQRLSRENPNMTRVARFALLIGILPPLVGTPSGVLAQPCPTDATRGALTLEITPAPGGEPLGVTLVGPGGFSVMGDATASYGDLPAGPYRAEVTRGERVTVAGLPVGRAWSPVVRGSPTCVRAGATARLVAEYAEEPGSHKLWIVDDLGSAAFALGPETFAASGPAAPAARLELGMNKARSIAFDPAGNLWVADISGQIASYGVWTLGRSGAVPPRLQWIGPAVADPVALAFDAEGGLWVTSRQQRVVRFAPEQLHETQAPTPQLAIPVQEPTGVVFDAEGNLWVASAGDVSALLRYDAHRLDGSLSGLPDATVIAYSPPPVIDVLRGPSGMAFDREGNLWVGYFGPNVIARLTASDLRASGEVTPATQLSIAVGALLESLAFDESGALWVSGESGQVLRLAPEQLRESGLVTPTVTLSPEGLRYAVGLALNPAVGWFPGGPSSRR